jgi:hypothetical protein
MVLLSAKNRCVDVFVDPRLGIAEGAHRDYEKGMKSLLAEYVYTPITNSDVCGVGIGERVARLMNDLYYEEIVDISETPHLDMRPRFAHACEECVYLGSNADADLYYCKKGLLGKTLIARHSDSGPDYVSGTCFVECVPDLWAAGILAEARGLGKFVKNLYTVAEV